MALAGCATNDQGPVMYGPTQLASTSATPRPSPGPNDPTPLTTATPGLIVGPAGSSAMCQLGATAARGEGGEQVRYAIVGKDCAAPAGTLIENVDDKSRLGTVAAIASGAGGTWSAVAVRLDGGVGWSPTTPGRPARTGDKVDVMGLGKRFTVTVETNGLLRLDGFSSPSGRSGASVLGADHRLVAISAGDGASAVPIAEVIRTFAAMPGLDGLALL